MIAPLHSGSINPLLPPGLLLTWRIRPIDCRADDCAVAARSINSSHGKIPALDNEIFIRFTTALSSLLEPPKEKTKISKHDVMQSNKVTRNSICPPRWVVPKKTKQLPWQCFARAIHGRAGDCAVATRSLTSSRGKDSPFGHRDVPTIYHCVIFIDWNPNSKHHGMPS